jgi:AraC-like DNA-binding protein
MPEPWKALEDVRVTNTGVAVYPPGATFGPRRMKDHEFVWIMEGEAMVHFDEHKIDAPAGSVLLCRPEMTDKYEWSANHKSVHAFFHFDLETIPDGWPRPAEWPLAHHLKQDDLLRPLFRYVLRTHPLQEPLRSSLLLPTVDLMLRSFVSGNLAIATEPFAELPGPVEKVLKKIRDISLQEPSPQVTLTQLAREAHVTPEHLCRLFRQSLDLGPLECVRLARLERAATLLGRSNLAIKEITESTGFSSPYHFSRRFSEVYGMSPRAYRQAISEGGEVKSNPISKALLINIFSRIR